MSRPGPSRTHTGAARLRSSNLPQERKNVVVAAHGRAPWYGPDGKNIEAYVIGIAGGSASGKVSWKFLWTHHLRARLVVFDCFRRT